MSKKPIASTILTNSSTTYHEAKSDAENNVVITIKENDIKELQLIIERFSKDEINFLDKVIKKYKEKITAANI
jgi:hypothetical protein